MVTLTVVDDLEVTVPSASWREQFLPPAARYRRGIEMDPRLVSVRWPVLSMTEPGRWGLGRAMAAYDCREACTRGSMGWFEKQVQALARREVAGA